MGIKWIDDNPDYTDDPINAYSMRHMVYNLNTIDFLVNLILLRMLFKVLKSNLGIRFGHTSIINKIFHYLLVVARIMLTLFCITWTFREGFWILDQTMYRLFV